MRITPELLDAATAARPERARLFAPHVDEACRRFGIETTTRVAAFLAQVTHECADFELLAESLNYAADRLAPTFGAHRITPEQAQQFGRTATRAAHEREIANIVYGGEWGRKNLGNVQPGDGWEYRGRGCIQTTGRSNYRELRPALLLAGYTDVPDFEAEPGRLAEPRWACAAAGHFWASRGCNDFADRGDFVGLTGRINGGTNGLADRQERWEVAKAALAQFADTQPPGEEPPPEPAHTPTTEWDLQNPPTEAPMVAPLVLGLVSSLIQGFAPLAREKLEKEMNRHTTRPEVAEQIAGAVMETVKAATGKLDAIEATAAAKADPAVMRQAEASALDELAKMAPMLDRLAALDAAEAQHREASMNAAAERAKGESFDMARPLLTWSLAVVALIGVVLGTVVIVQVNRAGGKVDNEVWALLVAYVTWATAKAGTLFDYRFGTSRSSSAKDVLIDKLSQRGRP